MHVVIVESPAKSKTINKYLGKDYKVLASFGHIRDLPSKNGSVRPDEDFAMTYEIDERSKKHVAEITKAMKGADSLILATDPDREGEAISWHVFEALKEKKAIKKDTPVKRVVFNEITKRAVLEGIANARDIDMDLVNAQQARRALDYLVGFTLSPILWRKLPGSRSAGRVQSVALRLICERESEIEAFISREYWTIGADLKTEKGDDVTARLTHLEGKKLDKFDINNEAQAQGITANLKQKQYKVTAVEPKQVRRNPAPPFITSTLQQEASRKLGFGAKKTMQIAQGLYEGIELDGGTTGLITYMRTDGVTVAMEAIHQAREVIGKRFGANYVPEKPKFYTSKSKSAQEAHEAIRPTDLSRTPESVAQFLDKDQLRLYDLIWKRMMASQMESAVLDQVSVDFSSSDGYAVLRATGSVIRFDGFFALYNEGHDDEDDEDERNRRLPAMDVGNPMKVNDILPEQHFTEPPPRYTEASLVKRLEELGIGRPSTYASIISVLQDREYVKLEQKRFTPEERGRLVTAFLENYFRQYVEYDFTAELEEELDEISEGKLNWKKVLHDFWGAFSTRTGEVSQMNTGDILKTIESALDALIFPKRTDGRDAHSCPSCEGGNLSLKLGKFGAFLGCSNYPTCTYTKPIGAADSEGATKGEGGEGDYPKVLGKDSKTGFDVSLRKGPYGFYIQLEDGEKKPKRATVAKHIPPESVTLEFAQGLIALPREVGVHPETGKPIMASIGRFGPYILHDGKYTSLKGDDDPVSIGINRAVDLIADSGKGRGKTELTPLKVLGNHPGDGKPVPVYEGRYGPYVKHGKVNASLTKGMTPDTITLEQALELLAARAAKGGATKKKPAAKSKAKKKS